MKNPFLMKSFFMDNLPLEEVLFKLKIHKNERKERLNKMNKLVEERWLSIKERNIMKARILLSSAVLKRGIEQEKQYIKWCEETIQFIEQCQTLWDDQEEPYSLDEFDAIYLNYMQGVLE
ncbi:hypothetical protein LC087_17390 [Bacillus carboniphilus]|uniref:Transcription regulator PadR C-terminal domain-containing protein n=1 Tax=Bacillus carboniphilus TaxID=86663 RepID=A0ABY9JXR7_9BACI|nr:hypothetical protein [Bacillus carboniphilus]WLR42451.1 hypothetical protein LC087_17390 [Bacillus carboniphilus]